MEEKLFKLTEEIRNYLLDFKSFSLSHSLPFDREIDGLLDSLDRPPGILVFGDVKTGKSTLINAILGENLCKTDDAPCTVFTTELRYGKEHREVSTGERQNCLFHPNERLKNYSFVDTPGYHSSLTEQNRTTPDSICGADMMLVVMSAKNPFVQDIWTFLKDAKDRLPQKLVFVYQMKDLVKPDDLEKNIQYVEDFARNSGFTSFVSFPVSAEKQMAGAVNESGINQLTDYLDSVFARENSRLSLLISKLTAMESILKRARNMSAVTAEESQNAVLMGEIESILEKNDRISGGVLVQYQEDYYDIWQEAERAVNELPYSEVNTHELRSPTFLRTFFKSIEQKHHSRAENLIQSFVNDILDDFQRTGERLSQRLVEAQFSRRLIYEEYDVKKDIDVSIVKSTSKEKLIHNQVFDALPKKTSALFADSFKKHNRRVFLQMILPFACLLLLLFSGMIAYNIFSVSPQTDDGETVESTAVSLDLSAGGGVAEMVESFVDKAINKVFIAFIILALLIWPFRAKAIHKSLREKLRAELETHSISACDEFKQNKDAFAADFHSVLLRTWEQLRALHNEHCANLLKKLFGENPVEKQEIAKGLEGYEKQLKQLKRECEYHGI